MASEVLEHIPDDVTAMAEISRVLKPGGRVAVTVPRYGPERICWALSDEYHANEGGHIRIYRARRRAHPAGRRSGWCPATATTRTPCTRPFWWLKCAVGVERDAAAVRAYHRLLVWDLTQRPWLTRTAERLLDPLFGKSLVVYADKPAVPPAGGRVGRRRRASRAGADRCRALTPARAPARAARRADRRPGARDRRLDRRRAGPPTARCPGSAAASSTPGTPSRRPWRSTSAASTSGPRRPTAGWPRGSAPTARGRPSTATAPSPRRPRRATTPATSPSAPGTAGCSPATSELVDRAVAGGPPRASTWSPAMQLPGGAIGWALRPDGTPDDTALLTGNASLFQALRCGIALAGAAR